MLDLVLDSIPIILWTICSILYIFAGNLISTILCALCAICWIVKFIFDFKIMRLRKRNEEGEN